MRPAFVVTVHHSSNRPNGHQLLDQYLTTLSSSLQIPYDVFIMENGSDTPYAFTKDHFYTYFPNQNGGMTKCWNHGVTMAIRNGNDFVCVTNEDLAFNPTINNFFEDVVKYPHYEDAVFGPICDNPSTFYPQRSNTISNTLVDITGKDKPIHGWFLGFSRQYFNKYSDGDAMIFDSARPWRGQESFQQRDWQKGSKSVVVHSCLVHHEHFGDWRKVEHIV